MDVRTEIAARIDKLPPEMREQVLRFVDSLAQAAIAAISSCHQLVLVTRDRHFRDVDDLVIEAW